MAKIIKIESYLPTKKITNEKLSLKFDKWTPEKIFSKTGIKERISEKTETAADLAMLAAENYSILQK